MSGVSRRLAAAWNAASSAKLASGATPEEEVPPAANADASSARTPPEAEKTEEEAEGEEEAEPANVEEWLAAQSDEAWTRHESFHRLFVNESRSMVLLAAHGAAIDPAADRPNPTFFVSLSKDGVEGGFRDCWNHTPKMVGLQLVRGPGGQEVWLCEAQQGGSKGDLAASMRSEGDETQPLGGFITALHPLVEIGDEVLLDLTSWFFSFSSFVTSGGLFSQGEAAGSGFGAGLPDMHRPDLDGSVGSSAASTSASNAWEAAVQDADRRLFAHVDARRCSQCASSSQLAPTAETSSPFRFLPPAARRMTWATEASSDVPLVVQHPLARRKGKKGKKRRPARSRGLGGGGSSSSGTKLLKVLAFPENFVLKFCTQSSTAPLKGLGRQSAMAAMFGGPPPDLTQYFSVCFAELPRRVMPPRRWDRRVGFFTTPVTVNGPDRVTQVQQAVDRWCLERRGNGIAFHVDPSIPARFHEIIREATESWNVAFAAAGRGHRVVRCLCPGDAEWPADYNTGDTRFNPIVMTETFVLGYGPSVVDFRSGEILHAAIVLGFSTFITSASGNDADIVLDAEGGGYGEQGGLVSATHPNVVLNLKKTVCHEVGHALGLRHNFLGAQDGNSSVMDYEDMWDTTTSEGKPAFGAHFLTEPGRYDVYAIKYGYTAIDEEWQPQGAASTVWADGCLSLALLANGQEAAPVATAGAALDPELDDAPRLALDQPQNPLFGTDECVALDGGDPRVTRWEAPGAPWRAGMDKIRFAIRRRQELLDLAETGRLRGGLGERGDGAPGVYSHLLHRAVGSAVASVVTSSSVLGGALLDAPRETAIPVGKELHRRLLGSCVEVLVGPLLRLSEQERQRALNVMRPQTYALAPMSVLALHDAACRRVLNAATHAGYLARLEDQRYTGASGYVMDTLDLLLALGFGPGAEGASPLLHPFKPPSETSGLRGTGQVTAAAVTEAGEDALRCQARLELAKAVARLAALDDSNPHISAKARAFIESCFSTILGVQGTSVMTGIVEQSPLVVLSEADTLPDALVHASPRARAAWLLFLQRLVKKPSSGGGGGFPMFRFGRTIAKL